FCLLYLLRLFQFSCQNYAETSNHRDKCPHGLQWVCSHTEAPDPNSQQAEPSPPDGGAPSSDAGAPPPDGGAQPQDAGNAQPAEPPKSEEAP
uniref:Uncharacterized protein n=1 Tax=Chenopodium quinoa TaxID=63459 RepID=A0A803LMS4_CHEQI